MSKASILIVEDEQIVALDIQNNLERNGYQIAGRADRGDKAIKMAEELHPDLILMDIGLKGNMDGIEAATQIRKRFDIPVIFLTAFSNQTIIERARLAEPFGYIVKPFDEREKIITIEMALYKHSMENKLRESEKSLREAQRLAHLGDWQWTVATDTVKWSEELCHINGRDPNLPAPNFAEMSSCYTPESWKRLSEVVAKALQSGESYELDLEMVRPDGTTRHTFARGEVEFDASGKIIGLHGTVQDITERKRADIELRKLSQAIEQSANSILITDIDGNIEYANPKFTEISGYTLPEVLGKTPRILRSGEQPPEFYQHLWQTIKSGKTWCGELHNKRKDGTFYWDDTTIAPVYDSAGKMISFIAIKEDITFRKMLEESERDQHRLAEALRDTAMALNSTLQLDDILDRILGNIGKLVKYDAAMVSLIEGNEIRKIRYHNNPQNMINQLPIGNTQANLLNTPILKMIIKTKQPYLIPDIQKDARWQAVTIPEMQRIHSLICVPILSHENVMGVINILSATPDFFTPLHTERIMAFSNQAAVAFENARLYEKAQHLSLTDPLTELYNMRYFAKVGKIEFERIQRYKRTLSVAMVDIDHFKDINDTYGHGVGDLALSEIATRIKNAVRTMDTVARYGGEEFIILMPETNLTEAYPVAERVRQIVADSPIENKDAAISATLSLGIAEIDKNTKNLDELIKHADQALYKAKANGRNCVEIYSNGR